VLAPAFPCVWPTVHPTVLMREACAGLQAETKDQVHVQSGRFLQHSVNEKARSAGVWGEQDGVVKDLEYVQMVDAVEGKAFDLSPNSSFVKTAALAACKAVGADEALADAVHVQWLTRVYLHRALKEKVRSSLSVATGCDKEGNKMVTLEVTCGGTQCLAPKYILQLKAKKWTVVKGRRSRPYHVGGCTARAQ
jgi:hypothetical protein